MTDLDQLLNDVRAMPTHTALDRIDAAVLHGLGQRRDRMAARRSLMLAAFMALGIGWAGSMVPAAPAQAAPLAIGMSDYAPSRLLGQ